MGKTRQRRRHAHTGVKLIQRERASGSVWIGRWTDPDSGKAKELSLTQRGITNEEARRLWAIEKSRELDDRRRQLAMGATPCSGATLHRAFETYFTEASVAPATLANYRYAVDVFLAWCESQGLSQADDLRPEHLAAYRAALPHDTLRVAMAGGSRGQRGTSAQRVSASTVNNRLRGLKAVLNQLRRRGFVPRLTQDDLTDQLRAIKEERPRPAFLKPQEIKRLLAAAVRHDAETYALTRAEKADGLGAGEGITRKHDSVLPLVVLGLLTGARLEELLSLHWEHVDLERGVIEFNAEHVKTGEDREVWLDKTPALARLLAALKLRSAGPFVIGGEAGWTRATATKARKRLTERFGAPEFNWSQRSGRTPALRSTCATYSVNAAGVWGEASIYVAARRLGHSVEVAERRYQRRHRVSHEATTLEEAMEAADAFRQAVDAVAGAGVKQAAGSLAWAARLHA